MVASETETASGPLLGERDGGRERRGKWGERGRKRLLRLLLLIIS
jgi:hypothetical protein